MSGALRALAAVRGRVVVRMPNWVGDALLALPAVAALAAELPGAQLELRARPAVAGVLAALQLEWAVDVARGARPWQVWQDASDLHGAAAVVLLPNSFVSALAPWLARVAVRVGADRDGRRVLLTHSTRPDRGLHQAAYYRAALGLDGGEALTGVARVDVRPEVRTAARRLLGERAVVALVPGAAFGTAKQWGPDRYGELARLLIDRGLEVVVLGTGAELELANAIASASGARCLAGQTSAAEFAGVLAQVGAVVANDSGALHLAAALGTPVVGVFGATDPELTGPIAGVTRVLYHPVACSPCGLRVCPRPRHDCMEAVMPSAVLDAIAAIAPGSYLGA